MARTVRTRRRKVKAASAKKTTRRRTTKRRTGAAAKTTRVHRRPNARRLNKISLGDAIERVMGARSKAIHYKDLTTTIEKRGLYKTRSKNLLSTVAVTLKRDRRFKKIEPGMYALRKK